MPAFAKGGTARTPFGHNKYLRSDRDLKFESYTCAAASVVAETVDGFTEKILRPGEVIAKITSGGDSGKVGPFQAGVADGRQTLANIVGINDTYLPWQLNDHDETIAVLYEGFCVQAWCYERDAAGARQVLGNTTAAGMFGLKGLEIHFK